MDERFVTHYINILSAKLNELNLENILLKSKLTLANEDLAQLRNEQENVAQLRNEQEDELNGNRSKTKTK